MSKPPSARPNRKGTITRRDFLEGVLLAAGGAAVSQFSPMQAFAQGDPFIDGPIGADPRVLHGGNLRETFWVAHWLRDGRLTFKPNSIKISPSPVDPFQGNVPLVDDTGDYDLIIVGGGISGLSAAFHARQLAPNARILILENNPRLGGNASRDFDSPMPMPGSSAGAYFAFPYAEFLDNFYDGIGIDSSDHIIPGPIYSYYFDSDVGPQTTRSAMNPGTAGWVTDAYSKAGIDDFPFSANLRKQFQAARKRFRKWYNTPGAPTDPADESDPAFDHLSFKTLREYLEVDEGYDPVIADFYDQYASDSFAGLTDRANAHTGISFLGAEYFDLVTTTGGLSFVARRALKSLIPGSIPGSTDQEIVLNPIVEAELDNPNNPVRYRRSATAIRVDDTGGDAEVVYYDVGSGNFLKAHANAVIMAGQMYMSRRVVEHLVGGSQYAAMQTYRHMPAPIANVVVNNSHFLVDAQVGYNFYWYGDTPRIWQDAVVGDWAAVGGTPAAEDGSRPNVITVYSGGFGAYEDAAAERVNLLNQPFSTYEDALRADFGRIFADHGFDFDLDVDAIHLYRWGHPFVAAGPGWLFGQPVPGQGQQVIRTQTDRHFAREPLGRVSFAAQDAEGNPAIEGAIFSGLRAVQDVLTYL